MQVCLYGHAEIHQHDAGKLAELERIREDAEARAQVFDDTVANLVRAKMAHATADVTLRAMRDQIEQLSAQVPLQNGYGTNAPSWRLANHAARLRAAAEPGVTAAVHKCVCSIPVLQNFVACACAGNVVLSMMQTGAIYLAL